ncbi:condensation domain-containing protein, partial [Bacillus subtilis]
WRDIPLQIVYKHKSSEWCFEDLRRFDVEEQKKYLNSYVESNKARGFQLSEDTLIRVAIFQIDEEVHRVIWSFHHILMDGWCLPLILKE